MIPIARVAAATLLAAAPAGGPAAAEAPVLDLPVDCEIGAACFVQNHFDLDPGPGRLDFGCGRLSYDGHDGTDFRAPDLPAMRRGVVVRAAAAGVVKATRDAMPDVSVRETGAAAVEGREAGNGVVLDHGDGWETQYSHLARGSVQVAPGQSVAAGAPLGRIGLSGRTEFPHVHFTVRKDGAPLDPFTGAAAWTCGAATRPLWSPAARDALAYAASGALVAGFAAAAPEAEAIRAGDGRLGPAAADPDALVFWADVFGAQAGDAQTISISGPDGADWYRQTEILADNNVSWFAFGGRRRPPDGWTPGRYVGRYLLTRDGAPVVDAAAAVEIGG